MISLKRREYSAPTVGAQRIGGQVDPTRDELDVDARGIHRAQTGVEIGQDGIERCQADPAVDHRVFAFSVVCQLDAELGTLAAQ